jgi:hypothetical protein
MRTSKRFIIPGRVVQIKNEAKDLFEKNYFAVSISRYAVYAQQMLIIITLFILRTESIEIAMAKRKEIEERVRQNRFTMGNTIDFCRRLVDESNNENFLSKVRFVDKCDTYPADEIETDSETPRETFKKILDRMKKISRIRNEISEHPGFVIHLDPNNQYKKGMYDTNHYRNVIKRKLKFFDEMGIPCEETKISVRTYFGQNPLTSLPGIENFFDDISKQLEYRGASMVQEFVGELDCLFKGLVDFIRAYRDQGLEK